MTPDSYLILALTAIAVHLIANHRILFTRAQIVEPKVNRALRGYLFCVLAFYCVEAGWGLMRFCESPHGLFFVTNAFFLLLFGIVLSGAWFSISYASHRDWSRRVPVGFVVVAAVIGLISLLVNFFTPFYFSVDESCAYSPGFLRTLTLVLYAASYLTGAVMVLFDGFRSQVEMRRRIHAVFAYRLTMGVAIAVNIFFPEYPCVTLGCLLGTSFINIFVREIAQDLLKRNLQSEIELNRAAEDRRKADALAQAREFAAQEQDRFDKERRINESLEILLSERDSPTAYRKIMAMWCEALGAQWCHLGRAVDGRYVIVESHAAEGVLPISVPGMEVAGILEFDRRSREDAASDYIPLTHCKGNPEAEAFARVSPNPDGARSVSSCYCHMIRFHGEVWGSLVIFFREPHVFTVNEEMFFKASAKGVELALERDHHLNEIRAERDRVLAAERARSLFFSCVSHDIRTPLNAIVGFAELLEKGVEDPAVRERYVATIRASGKMLARLVNDILDLSKLESGKLEIIAEPTDVPALAREVFEAFESVQTRKSVRMETDIAAMPLVSVDQQRIRQLLYNLLSNACKYTDHGRILLRTVWRDGTLTLAVADTGRGISPEDIERILQPFVQVVDRNNRNGTGLGLSICQRLAQLMGGELKIESELGKGSTFSIVIPNVKTVDRISVSVPEAERLADTKVRRVLVVDDSSVNRLLLKAMLTRCGVEEVVVAENGRKALDLLRDDPTVDLVLTDLWMPEMDGEGLVCAIRETPGLVHLPVYLVTADVEAVRQHREKGFTGILLKPITQEGVQKLCLRGQ